MYKNKTLKGLAISAVLALGFSGLAAAPASANYGLADKSFVSVAPASGDEWNVFSSASFTVRASKASSLTIGTLKLLVEDVAGNLTATSSSTVSAEASVMPSTYTGSLNGVKRKSASDNTFVLAASGSNIVTADFPLSTLNKTVFSASHEVKITAWNDANNDGLIQSTEYASPTETIKFVDADDVTLNVVLNRPFVGDTSISATVTTTPTLNADQGANLETLKTELGFDLGFNRDGYADTASFDASSVWNSASTARNYTFYSEQFDDAASWAVTTISSTALAAATVSVAVSSSGLAVFTTSNSHNAIVGDSFQFTTSSVVTSKTLATVSKIVSSTVFEASIPTTVATVSATVSSISDVVPAFNKVTAGTYGVTPYWKSVAASNIQLSTVAVTSADVEVNVAATVNNQGIVDGAGTSGTQALSVRSGTTTVEVTATVVDKDGDPIAAGRAVVISNTRTGTATINGKTAADTVLTDANGQVKATVVTPAGAAGTVVALTFTPEGVSAAESGVTLNWVAASFSMKDLSVANENLATSRSIVAGGSYTMDLAVMDQWFVAPASTVNYRVAVTGAGATNGLVTMTGGRAQITVADNGTALSYRTVLTLQKQNANGTWSTEGTAVNVDTDVKTGAVVLGAANTSLYNSVTVTLSSLVAAKALVEADLRVAQVAIPDYKYNAVVAGVVRNASTGVAVAGATVTFTGPTNMLFNVGDKVYKRGTVTLVAGANGQFSVEVLSTTAQKDTEITVTSMGNSATTKLTFTGIGVGEGTALAITAPDTVEPASTLQVKAKLTDAFGNAVTAAAGRMKVSYTGPGIIFGTLPTSTDTAGELMFSALLGAADKGTITVVVSYDQNGDGDFVDTKDLNTTKTITIGAAAPTTPVVDKVLTVGSFKGFVAIYAKGYAGSKLSAKVAGKWLTVSNLSAFQRVVRLTGAGFTIKVDLYIDGKFVESETVVTK